MLCLTFAIEQDAINALVQINTNKDYPVVGINAATGLLELTKQQTIRWDYLKKIVGLNKWYFKKPEEKFIVNIINYEEEIFDNSWTIKQQQL